MKNLMLTLRVPEDMPIENKMISKSIESAQKKVEGNNFDIRKHLVEYDDVINKHRLAIYRRRREILEITEGVAEVAEGAEPKTLSMIIIEMISSEIAAVVHFHTAADDVKEWNIKEITETMRTIWSPKEDLKNKLEELAANGANDKVAAKEKMIEYLISAAKEVYATLPERFKAANIELKREYLFGRLISFGLST